MAAKRPPGIIDWMHYGFALRYGGIREYFEGEDELRRLEDEIANVSTTFSERIRPLLERRAWVAGSLMLRLLPELYWSELSGAARGQYLAGLARHILRAAHPDALDVLIGDQLAGVSAPEVFDVSAKILQELPAASLNAAVAAEIGANAIKARRLDVLRALLAHSDFDGEAKVNRTKGDCDRERFARQLAQHSTRLLDVLLEAAVRCHNPEAMRFLLECGASPDIPCWNLERSFSDWFSGLSFAIFSLRDIEETAPVQEMVDLLLAHEANPQGLECEGKNNPLMHAMRGRHWQLADQLLDLGARFEGGWPFKREDFEKPGPLIPAGHPLIGYNDADLQWAESAIGTVIPLAKNWEVPLYYKGNGQGGWVSTFLNCVLADEQLPLLKKYEARGLPTTLTPCLIIDIIRDGCHDALMHLLRDNSNLPRVMFRIRRRDPGFGTSMRQVWLCQPETDGLNVVENFDAYGQTPLQLPDGSRVYAHLNCVAPPDHNHGPITEGCFWLEKITAEYRRRGNRIITRNVRRMWRMEPAPSNDCELQDMIPLVKEVDGRFMWLGVTMRSLMFGQRVPAEWRPAVKSWLNGDAWQHIRSVYIERGKAQRAANKEQPKPVLERDELVGYPMEFWPFLRRLGDGRIGVTPESCHTNPGILDIYAVWERQNKPDRNFQPDARLLEWPLWPQVPVELKPYFYFDEVLGVPSITFQSRNSYEKEMIHRAVQWKNSQFLEAAEEAGLISGFTAASSAPGRPPGSRSRR